MHESNPLIEMTTLDTLRERQQTASRLARPRRHRRSSKRRWRKEV
jgi:hypothetical protein